MKIAILGTRGIPNRYGGFEQGAENLSTRWVSLGHYVTVYNPKEHPYKNKEWNGVNIKHIFSNEKILGTFGNIIFDYLCIKDSLKMHYDIVLELGYAAALFYPPKSNRHFKIITNMDGLEWKRGKWSAIKQIFLKYLENEAVSRSDVLIADNPGIQDYLKKTYGASSTYIPYGATIFEDFNEKQLENYNLKPFTYYLIVARLEPENNIEMILDGYAESKSNHTFIVVGDYKTKYGKYLVNKYDTISKIKFIGSIYNNFILNNLRYFSKIYFHGHSVGGTNPSLLEAMACSCNIAAYDCTFNRYVLGEDAFYFADSRDVSYIINNDKYNEGHIHNNITKIKFIYNWDLVSKQYLDVFINALGVRE